MVPGIFSPAPGAHRLALAWLASEARSSRKAWSSMSRSSAVVDWVARGLAPSDASRVFSAAFSRACSTKHRRLFPKATRHAEMDGPICLRFHFQRARQFRTLLWGRLRAFLSEGSTYEQAANPRNCHAPLPPQCQWIRTKSDAGVISIPLGNSQAFPISAFHRHRLTTA